MSVARTAARRRKQYRQGFKHLPPLRRPKYKRHDASYYAKKRDSQLEKLKQFAANKAKSNKK